MMLPSVDRFSALTDWTAYAYLQLQEDTRKGQGVDWTTHLMFLSPRNEPPEDTQELINSAGVPNCEPSTAPRDMESGRGGAGASGSVSPSRSSTSGQLKAHAEEPEPGRGAGFWDKCFSVPFLLLLGVTASLVVLPLVLPPLPPPPSMLMLVPVAMLLVLLVLAFMPTSSSGRSGTNPTY
ncbi:hypothetical protein EJB05_37738 [Eragrostis curvula]|uniref:Uncharacterized protein n=1 Tax=Eragrostis curvula TaxID=38414 RepID=A0A5J9TTY9_9POAL|nr:hypothetical protein EJB05_37738 [Eragrostis curvula]